MDYSKITSLAQKMASTAKNGKLQHEGQIYTLLFNESKWVYDIFRGHEYYLTINSKCLKTAKKDLKFYLEH